MKCSIKKVLLYIPLILFVGITAIFIIKIAVDFFGLPFGKTIARHNIEKYIKIQYSEEKLYIGKITYSFKENAYCAKIQDNRHNTITQMSYQWQSNTLGDSNLSERTDKVFQIDLESFKKRLDPSITIDRAFISVGITADQDFKENQIRTINKLYILGLTNKDHSIAISESNEKFVDLVKDIFYFLEDKYDIVSSQILYKDRNGEKELFINNTQSKLPKEEIKKLIHSK